MTASITPWVTIVRSASRSSITTPTDPSTTHTFADVRLSFLLFFAYLTSERRGGGLENLGSSLLEMFTQGQNDLTLIFVGLIEALDETQNQSLRRLVASYSSAR